MAINGPHGATHKRTKTTGHSAFIPKIDERLSINHLLLRIYISASLTSSLGRILSEYFGVHFIPAPITVKLEFILHKLQFILLDSWNQMLWLSLWSWSWLCIPTYFYARYSNSKYIALFNKMKHWESLTMSWFEMNRKCYNLFSMWSMGLCQRIVKYCKSY